MDPNGTAGLLARAGVDARRFRNALALLSDGSWWTLADLVRATATSRRGVEALLREVQPQRSGDRFRLSAEQIAVCRDLVGGEPGHGHQPADPVAHLLPRYSGVVEQMAELIAKAPRSRHALDHVSATPETVVRRALLLDARFWLDGARLLCVGDHDLTSLAVAMICPDVEISVVDIDERILAYIDEQSAKRNLSIRTSWADLRLGLPASALEQADLAITDPPYTPEGIGLFVARAVEGLRDPEQGRVLLAYGVGERMPMLALKVQHMLGELNLVNEAIYPDFNRYLGAEAIGSAADLYVLRPTTKTPPAVAARVEKFGTAIYTKGAQSVESRPGPEGMPDAAAVQEFEPEVLAGDWPRDVLPRLPRVRLATWLAKPYASAPQRVAIALPAGLAPALPRLLLATRAQVLCVLLAEPLRDLAEVAEPLAPVYRLSVRGSVLQAVRLPVPQEETERLVRGLLDRAHGKIINNWRESLISVAGELTKNEARTVITQVAPWAVGMTALELPRYRLLELPSAVAATLRTARVTR